MKRQSVGWLFCLVLGTLVVPIAVRPARAAGDDDDNWQVVTAPAEQPAQAAKPEKASLTSKPSTETIVACGERVTAASPEIQSIVAEINRVWNSDVQVYQSIEPYGPHARPGGCVFYNSREMAGLLNGWMNIKEAKAIKPMIYAIFAHEIGHEVHHDFDSTRAGVPSDERELEADRFAGYTMSYLRIRPDDIETYYRLTGDDFTGGHGGHGTSDQRANAFEHGWKLAEAGSAEQSVVPARGLGRP